MRLRATQAELVEVGTVLRGLQRISFVVVLVNGLRFTGEPRWLVLALATLWLPVLWRAVVLTNCISSHRPKRLAAALAAALVLLAATTTIDGLRFGSWGSPTAQWTPLAAVLLTLPWLGLLRHLAVWSGLPNLMERVRRVSRMARWMWAGLLGGAGLGAVVAVTVGGNWPGLVLASVLLAALILEFRLWRLTRETWQTFGADPSTLAGEPAYRSTRTLS